MGQVFSWNDLVEDRVPKVQDFSIVGNKIRETFAVAPGVRGAVLCGSFLLKNHNERSDIDVVVLYDRAKRAQVSEAIKNIYSFARKFHVPVEIHPIDTETARTALHHIDLSFAMHLERAIRSDGLIGKFSLNDFSFVDMTPKHDVQNYLRSRLRSLEEGLEREFFMNETDACRFRQKVLETPIRVARKMMWLYNQEMEDDSGLVIAKGYQCIPNPKRIDLFEQILAVDAEYNRVVSLRRGELTVDSYELLLASISKVALSALEFVRAQRV